MNTIFSHHKKRLSLLRLDRNAPVSVSATAGTVVACLHGELWITQSGEREGFFVAGGYRYHSRSSGLIVVSAHDGPSTAMVYWLHPDQAPAFSNPQVRIDPEGTTRLKQNAQRLRHKALGHLLRSVGRHLCCVAGSFIARMRIFLMQRKPAVMADETAVKTDLAKIRLGHCHAKTHL